MTFEAGRKRQLLVLQPKGKPLYDGDSSSSFGLKMLESMGWKKGNGLGRNQQGSLNFIQVRYRNNSNGLGFDGLKDNQWTENESNFDSLLKNLNAQSNSNSNSSDETEQKKAAKSLEEMSKQSRARVHYKKFTRGKDVYKYSEKDLANILGKKSLKEPEQKEVENEQPVEDDKPDTYKSDLIINAGVSITEYFKQKKKEKSEKKVNGHHIKHDHKNELQKFIEEDIEVDNAEVPQDTSEKSKKRKKKKSNENDCLNGNELTKIEDENQDNESNTKKRKKKQKDLIEFVEEEPEVPMKKKKKSKSKNAENQEVIEEITQDVSETTQKKKKKKNDKRQEDSEVPEKPTDVSNNKPESSQTNKKNSNDVDRPRGANAIYSTDVILIPSHVAQKMTSVQIKNFNHSNLGDIVGYGMSDDIEIKIVDTKMGDKSAPSNDKYALYNMDRITKPRINPRKILTKIKKTKKSIQVI